MNTGSPAVIDAHHHFWRYHAPEFDWITDEMAVLRRDFLFPELETVAAETGVRGVISVQARCNLDETAFLLEQADRHPSICGVVGWIPLRGPDAAKMLDQFAPNRKFRGVRENIQNTPDAEFLDHPDLHRGLRELARRGLAYDLLITPPQLPAAIRCVDAIPELRFILDHAAKPEIRRSAFPQAWADQLSLLAQRPNVWCKLSGLVTEVRDPEWDHPLLQPYFDTILQAFGPHRIIFGSDWPVCLVRSPYRRWLEAAQALTASLTSADRTAIFAENARQAYRLDS